MSNKSSIKEELRVEDATQDQENLSCGVVMPISEIDGCSAEHWSDVLTVIGDSLKQTDFNPVLVSDGDDSGVIHKRIVQNLYDNEIVICDVSGRNPNVMFELGMRLAFDKPTVIIKDDKTDYSFDTSVIEHLSYPRDLRHGKIEQFKSELADKVVSTYKVSSDPNYTTFLKHFGSFTVASIPTERVPENEFIIKSLESIKSDVASLKSQQSNPANVLSALLQATQENTFCAKGSETNISEFIIQLKNEQKLNSLQKNSVGKGHFHIKTDPAPNSYEKDLRKLAGENSIKISWVR